MMGQYYVLLIIILLTFLYLLSYFLYTAGNMSARSYKLIWNILLIISSILVGITGVVMVIFINFGMLPVDSTLIYWHVELGILAAVTGIFHIHIYWKQFKKIF